MITAKVITNQIVQCYAGRWKIEVLFKKSKGNYHLTKYSYHTKKDSSDNIQRQQIALRKIYFHIAFSLIDYMIINWYRVKYTKMGITTDKEVRLRIKDYFGKLPTKTLLNTFSAYG